ncbi:MAG: DUF4280 domain-containing protein [Myxococcota bacterium]|nr:DUF4280 domain-containing protein [Myxococcota bacterium]
MGTAVTMGAMMSCSFGQAPASLIVMRPTLLAGSMPAANIMDAKPMVNIPTFAMCMTPSNPMVAAATAAAMGVPTPAPCVPATVAWLPTKPTVLVDNLPILTSDSKCMCSYGGVISISSPGSAPTVSA